MIFVDEALVDYNGLLAYSNVNVLSHRSDLNGPGMNEGRGHIDDSVGEYTHEVHG